MTDLATLGQAMRDAQRAYFKDRTKENLIASKQAESAFDKALKEPPAAPGPVAPLIAWAKEAARYFEKRPTGGEDAAHWANVANAENARKVADAIATLSAQLAAAEAEGLKVQICKRTAVEPGEWVLEISGSINDCAFVSRHTEPLTTALEDVAGLPSLYEKLAAAEARADEAETRLGAGILDRLAAGHKLSAALAREAKLREALEIFQSYGCPVCNGDCGSANPPVTGCPMHKLRTPLASRRGGE